ERIARAGGRLLTQLLPKWISGEVEALAQDDSLATYIKLVKKEDGLIDLVDNPETNYRKVLAYSTWPGAYIYFKRKTGDEIRVVIKNAKLVDLPAQAGVQLVPTKVIPAGRKEMNWEDFLRGNA
ncbi:hypothetical protein KW807_02190, partial [Candidatus Parcubacteria bacterium]|nr:hypothetical protein [Candidatus Parcubacteria bacterium]